MVNEQLLDYIKKELARGIPEDKLRHVLMEHGWPEFEIHAAFEKIREAPTAEPQKVEEKPEDVLKEITKELPEEEMELPEEKHAERKPLEEKPAEKPKKPSFDIKKIVFSKMFLIVGAVIILISVAYFVVPLFLQEKRGSEGNAMDYAENMCRQYCQSNLCGLFTDPDFKHEDLKGKTCKDLGISCLQETGEPKCETSY